MKKLNKKKKLNWIIFGLLLLLIFTVIINNRTKNGLNYYVYEGSLDNYTFLLSQQGDHFLNWSVVYKLNDIMQTVKEYHTPFPYGPNELEEIEINDFRKEFQDAQEVYITRDVLLDSKTKSQIVVSLLNLDRVIEKFKTISLLASIENNDMTQELNLPIITCGNSNENRFVIWLKEGEKNRIYKENDYCIVGEFEEGDDPNKVATKIAYHIIGVM
jgi:hypothetical protein